LAEVTEKQARGQPHLQNVLFGAKKKRKRSKKTGGKESGGEMSSESDEENSAPATKRNTDLMQQRLPTQRPPALRLEKEPVIPEQIEPSRILEQSMATAEVSVYYYSIGDV
jgi:hypothetical protein